MIFKENQTFIAKLITIGRKTGKSHSVELRAVFYQDKIYFSRRNPNSDWLKNALYNPEVIIEHEDQKFIGKASLVKDENLSKSISQIKYPDKRNEESRIVLQVSLCE